MFTKQICIVCAFYLCIQIKKSLYCSNSTDPEIHIEGVKVWEINAYNQQINKNEKCKSSCLYKTKS